jgi:hypothetical protein
MQQQNPRHVGHNFWEENHGFGIVMNYQNINGVLCYGGIQPEFGPPIGLFRDVFLKDHLLFSNRRRMGTLPWDSLIAAVRYR